jgi:nicotinamidase-related amidase
MERGNTALLVIDIQEKLIGNIWNRESLLENVETLVHLAHVFEMPILVTEQYPKGLGSTVSTVAEVLKDSYDPIEKMTFSCVGCEEFNGRTDSLCSSGIHHLIVCGIETHICVYQTVRDLSEDGVCNIHLASDAVGSRKEANWRWGLDLMREEGAFIKPTETMVFEMLTRSGTSEFKAMLSHIK